MFLKIEKYFWYTDLLSSDREGKSKEITNLDILAIGCFFFMGNPIDNIFFMCILHEKDATISRNKLVFW